MPTITSIYNQGPFATYLLRPVGLAANWLNATLGQTRLGKKLGLDGRHVEKDCDIYRDYALIAAEIVKQDRLPASTQKLLLGFCGLRNGPLYLVTGLTDLGAGQGLRARSFFANERHLKKMGVRNPFASSTYISEHFVRLKTLGQYWGAARPRIISAECGAKMTEQQKLDHNPTRRRAAQSPVARFMEPK